ncbi:MAG: hypothetical protein JXR95_11530 [Deltaproteobacteria bacterium]|nr:hypothetical protein [Deltaproteobacteria bacterium]
MKKILLFLAILQMTLYSCSFDTSGTGDPSVPHCADNGLSGDESDVDCGGSDCEPCAADMNCNVNSDCLSGYCNDDGKCSSSPTCDDNILNSDETDVDCGGSNCEPCGAGLHCITNEDCITSNCGDGGICIFDPQCTDHEKNGDETDVDCGGSLCSPCEDTKNCLEASDCLSGVCGTDGTCAAPSCNDTVTNGNETDTDCGGDDCPKCEPGYDCIENSDCTSDVCDDNVCAEPSCNDTVTNGNETDIDCGGNDCPKCEPGYDCIENSDCTSDVCDDNVCAEPSCTDTVLNGTETDIDCGGNDCPKCAVGDICISGNDCEEGVCDDTLLTCSEPLCTDSVENGIETDEDCGGTECPQCAVGKKCLVDSDCISLVCDPSSHLCLNSTCTDSVMNGYESDIDCGGIYCEGCLEGQNCNLDIDCASGYCNSNVCENTTSCKELKSLVPATTSGFYHILTESGSLLNVYCHIETSGTYTLYYITSGATTYKTSDTNSCNAIGLELFTPTQRFHYSAGRDFALSQGISTSGDFMGPLGIYNPNNGDDLGINQWCEGSNKCCHKKMMGGLDDDTVSDDVCGFTSLAGNEFWASDLTSISEPNGDYDANCWLNFDWDSSGNLNHWNDQDCDYGYSSYLCMAYDDIP